LAKERQPAGDLSMGRLIVVGAVVVGAGALMGYGIVKLRESRERPEDREARDGRETKPGATKAPGSSLSALVTRAQAARRKLDTTALQELEGELAAAAQANPTAPEASELLGERVAVLASLSLESCVRASVAKDAPASEQANVFTGKTNALVEQHEPRLDPGLVLAARARDTLCSGKEDVLALHPAVLHPGFRDHELRYALLAEPLWRAPGSDAAPFDDRARANLVRALEQLPEPTAFERLTLALALPDTDPRAQSIVGEVLASVPAQPLARAVQAHLRSASQVAVADPLPIEPVEPAEVEPPAPTEPGPTQPTDPVRPKKTGQPKQPSTGQPKQPSTGQPKQPKQPKAPGDLAEEGCKLVHGGKAEAGFAMLQKAFDQDPRDTKVILCMAEGHMKLGRLPSARAMVERVLRASSKNKKALQLAGKIEDQLGNERSAADYYRKLLELEPDNATAKAYVEKHGG
jgi:tetratricopeptide (TPR) repeat protein